ncbi:MAG: ATP-binding protein [Cyanobacteria bacterium]|nr:ATP-binding protein [Cyanobacteriota bacterium]
MLLAYVLMQLATAIGISLLIARSLLQPLQQVTNMARQVQREADFDLRVSVNSKDEVGELADAFNALIDRVQTLMREQGQTQAQLFQSEKMASLGQLVAGVAHEINNPANFIHGNLTHFRDYAHQLLRILQLYNTHYPEPVPEIQDALEDADVEFLQTDIPKMLTSMEMGTDLIRQIVLSLRNFSRLDEADAKAVDLHEGIDNTLLILQHRLKERPERPAIQVVKQYDPLPLVECYPGQINQVFMNVVANAIDAIEEAGANQSYQDWATHPGQITIRTRPMAGNWVEINITDNGKGMSTQTLKRLFDPFFTTKPVGKGTGIGMAISHQIITEGHSGTLNITSQPGQGTEVAIGIPVQGIPAN